MSAKRDLVTEIEGVRGRTGPTDWDNGITKLLFLCNQIQKLAHETEEQSYYPVACFAALEVDFRWEIRNLVDSGDTRFIKNVRVDELQIIIDHDLLIASHGKRVTIGELKSRIL
jgi:hypothetical protein